MVKGKRRYNERDYAESICVYIASSNDKNENIDRYGGKRTVVTIRFVAPNFKANVHNRTNAGPKKFRCR